MPLYTYRREDGTTFDYRQKFLDDALTVDPETGQRVVRVVQAAGVIFKGSGFYVNDSKSGSRSTLTTPPKSGDDNGNSKSAEAKENGKSADSSSESKPAESKDTKPATESKTAPKTPASAAAD